MRPALAALLLAALPAAASEPGRALFEARCAACHAAERGAPPGAGPNLAGVVGRRIGGDPDYGYSPPVEAAGAAGQRWDAALLARFLADPDAMFPASWMGGNGVSRAEDRAAVVEFLATTR